METIMAIAIGVLAASGTWLLLRPRTFQVIIDNGTVALSDPNNRQGKKVVLR